ncbi:alpha/beta-hydrolase [Laetiporus sulphureus 93-53]|uniref:Alpha/beta-hydrolase n=1 Tax=Laetiporus sulphureus 93-53 TaxID=1314785 RepID=A0A165DIY0_9APHY|nr:alpha/beta-hydrolase [Laetiporus sulphureus 93-53]KZT04985.1 alpha/beta-hydrolase [Laetiporus sulphureus 93-53]
MSATFPLPSSLPPHESFKRTLRKNHLKQLREVEISRTHIPGTPLPLPPGAPSLYDQLVDWSKQASVQIAEAVASQAISSTTIGWNIGVLTLLESAAVYLRDNDTVFQAVAEARRRTNEADERALQLLADSQTEIKQIAALWGLEFEVICDLLTYSPEGRPFLSGPYAGVFWPKDTNKPFLGLAFKGTNGKNWKEVLVDLDFPMMKAKGKILWGSPLHRGFYQTMFVKFPGIGSAPLDLDYIKDMVDAFLQTYKVPEGITINLHSTGHSLGAAYATLCYSELMRLYNNAPTELKPEDDEHAELALFFSQLKERQFVLRDLYAFGCPRVGGVEDNISWAQNYKTALDNHMGQSWRIVNKGDPVTDVPPVIPFISTWNHIDNGYEINPPKALPTEIGTQPEVKFPPFDGSNHDPEKYFQNLYNASISGLKSTVPVEWVVADVEPPNDADLEKVEDAAALASA